MSAWMLPGTVTYRSWGAAPLTRGLGQQVNKFLHLLQRQGLRPDSNDRVRTVVKRHEASQRDRKGQYCSLMCPLSMVVTWGGFPHGHVRGAFDRRLLNWSETFKVRLRALRRWRAGASRPSAGVSWLSAGLPCGAGAGVDCLCSSSGRGGGMPGLPPPRGRKMGGNATAALGARRSMSVIRLRCVARAAASARCRSRRCARSVCSAACAGSSVSEVSS